MPCEAQSSVQKTLTEHGLTFFYLKKPAESGEAIAMTTSGELFSVLLLNKETEEIEEISYYDWLENYCGKI